MDLRDPKQEAPEPGDMFRLKAAPIAIAVLAGLAMLFLAMAAIEFVKLMVKLPERPQMPWILDSYYHVVYAVLALVVIAWMRRRHPEGFGLGRPEEESFAGEALRWGVFFGIVMVVVDYLPQILALSRPADNPYPLGAINLAGWFVLEGVFVAFVEELMFRGLLLNYLALEMPGHVSFRGIKLSGAGVVTAVLFALYSTQFLSKPGAAPFQLVYEFLFGVAYAWWYERSKSLLAPVVAHSAANITKYALVFAMVAAFR